MGLKPISSLLIFNHDRCDHLILCGDLTNFDFIMIAVVINHVILCRFIAHNNIIFNHGH